MMVALTYLLIGVGTASCCGTRLKQFPWLMFCLIFAAIGVPLLFDATPRNILQAFVLLFVLAVEALFKHNDYQFTSDDNLRNAALLSAKRTAFLIVNLYVLSQLSKWAPVPWSLNNHGVPLWVQSLATLFVTDLFAYFYHRGQHHFNVWWSFHKMHHASTELTTLASGRTHILDFALKVTGYALLAYALGVSAEAYLYGFVLPVAIIDAFQHSNVNFPGKKLRFLGHIFVLPNFHALHHSKSDYNVNYGLCFSFWDKIFGTYKWPVKRPTDFGVSDPEWENKGLFQQHLAPLFELGIIKAPTYSAASNSKETFTQPSGLSNCK